MENPVRHRHYGFRHGDSIDALVTLFQQLAQQSGAFEVDRTEDVSLLTAINLRNYDAVYFFTSGELPLIEIGDRAMHPSASEWLFLRECGSELGARTAERSASTPSL